MKYIIAILLLFILGCNTKSKEGNNTFNRVLKTDTSVGNIGSILPQDSAISSVITNVSKPQTFNLSNNKKSTIIGNKGLKINVDPANLEKADGTPVNSNIILELKEMVNQRDLFLNDAQTIADGKLLVSGGAYYIALKSDGEELRLKAGKALSIQIPKLSNKEMQLFYGEKNDDGILNWVAANKNIIAEKVGSIKKDVASKINTEVKPKPLKDEMSTNNRRIAIASNDVGISLEAFMDSAKGRNYKMSVEDFKRIANSKTKSIPRVAVNDTFETGDYSQKRVKQKDSLTGKIITKSEISYYQPTEIKTLGWINCDRFYDKKLEGQIQCNFDTTSIITEASIYVIFKNINSLIKENITKSKNSNLLNLNSKIPIGESINLIAIAKSKGKFYSFKKEFISSKNDILDLKFSPESAIDVTSIVY